MNRVIVFSSGCMCERSNVGGINKSGCMARWGMFSYQGGAKGGVDDWQEKTQGLPITRH